MRPCTTTWFALSSVVQFDVPLAVQSHGRSIAGFVILLLARFIGGTARVSLPGCLAKTHERPVLKCQHASLECHCTIISLVKPAQVALSIEDPRANDSQLLKPIRRPNIIITNGLLQPPTPIQRSVYVSGPVSVPADLLVVAAVGVSAGASAAATSLPVTCGLDRDGARKADAGGGSLHGMARQIHEDAVHVLVKLLALLPR
mmetsp:Transcript_1010/g.2447  ORF Transcript_1010/g.2447 Transcript_1010/m.2447 type:complete len:202 (+) Transcript_1010:142-747(+)